MARDYSAYKELARKDDNLQRCAVCGVAGSKKHLDRHHHKRRVGENLLEYIYVCRACHNEIENDGDWAREKGFLE